MTSEIRENEHLDWLPFLVVARGGVRHGYARFVDWPVESVRPTIAGYAYPVDAYWGCDMRVTGGLPEGHRGEIVARYGAKTRGEICLGPPSDSRWRGLS
jgi:hypothetical protein